MTAIVSRCGELVADEITVSAGTAEIGRLTVGSGPEITAISGDTSMMAASDSILATTDAVDGYIADHDVASLVAAKKYTDDRTGNSYYGATFHEGYSFFLKAHGEDSGTIEFTYGKYGLALSADEPINMNSAIRTSTLGATRAGFRNEAGNYRWTSEPLDPQPVTGVAGPQIMQTVDWATYAFAPLVDSTYFANVMIPFNADHDGQATELRFYMRYSMSGNSTEPITFRMIYQLTAAGDVMNAGNQYDTVLTPSGTANMIMMTRLMMPDVVTPANIGSQFALSFARIGRNSPNPDHLFVWDISLVYNHAVWGVFADEL